MEEKKAENELEMKREIKYLLESWLTAKNVNSLNISSNNPLLGGKGGVTQTQKAIILKYNNHNTSRDGEHCSIGDNDEFCQEDMYYGGGDNGYNQQVQSNKNRGANNNSIMGNYNPLTALDTYDHYSGAANVD